jgi:hypothetical protein
VITNKDLLIDYLAKWLADYAKASGKTTFIVGFRGTIPDAILLHICSKAAELYGDLSVEAVTCSINVNIADIFNGKTSCYQIDNQEGFYLYCHRIAKDNGIIVGPIDRSFGLYYRSYGKRAEGTADIFPLFDLSYLEIKHLSGNILIDNWEDENYSMYRCLPSVHDIDFCNEAESLYGIITCEDLPNKHPRWPYFIGSQKEIIAKVWQREKLTRHKKIDRPYPMFYDKPQLINRR